HCLANLGGYHEAKWRFHGVSEIQSMPEPLERLEQIRKEPLRRRFYDGTYAERSRKRVREFEANNPEKREAWRTIAKLPKKKGYHLHHWSYNPEHYEDVIPVLAKYHKKLHAFMVY